MTLSGRIQRLRRFIARLEDAPSSERRDALLREARQRVLALEVGEQPSGWPILSTPARWSDRPAVARDSRGLGARNDYAALAPPVVSRDHAGGKQPVVTDLRAALDRATVPDLGAALDESAASDLVAALDDSAVSDLVAALEGVTLSDFFAALDRRAPANDVAALE